MSDEDEMEIEECSDDDGPYCACDLEPTIEEADWGICDCCGKPLY